MKVHYCPTQHARIFGCLNALLTLLCPDNICQYACCRRGHQAVAAAADEAVQHIASSRAAAEELRAQQAHREAELSQHCSHLQQQAEQLQDALQQQLEDAQQTAAARQQQLMVRGSTVASSCVSPCVPTAAAVCSSGALEMPHRHIVQHCRCRVPLLT
jgi:exonuclease VII large subunit